MIEFRKAIRTLQNLFPGLGDLKNDFYYHSRKTFRIPHERDFAIVASLPKWDDDLYLDVGGNHGQSILSMRIFRTDMKIISFEPSPRLYAEMVRRFGGTPLTEIRNYGLGSAETTLPLYVPSYNGFVYDGLATFSYEAATNHLNSSTLYFFNPKRLSVQKMECHIKTLDSLDLAPTFMKIDVEGFEYEVLAGGMETVKRHEPVIMIERYWDDPRVFKTLSDLGYAEVAWKDGRFSRGTTTRLNAIMMTERRFSQCPQ
jgi:FkbM family methyltransferase